MSCVDDVDVDGDVGKVGDAVPPPSTVVMSCDRCFTSGEMYWSSAPLCRAPTVAALPRAVKNRLRSAIVCLCFGRKWCVEMIRNARD